MKYFKRHLLDGQRDEDDKRWMQAIEEYREYMSDVFGGLSEDVQEYEIGGFHDLELNAILANAEEQTVEVHLGDGTVLRFSGVARHQYSGEPVSDRRPNVWLYDELELLDDGLIEFRILLEDGELLLHGASVEVR